MNWSCVWFQENERVEWGRKGGDINKWRGHYVISKRSHGISESETGVRETPLERETEMFSYCFIVWQMLKVFYLHNWRNYMLCLHLNWDNCVSQWDYHTRYWLMIWIYCHTELGQKEERLCQCIVEFMLDSISNLCYRSHIMWNDMRLSKWWHNSNFSCELCL